MFKENGLCSQNMKSILGSIVNRIEEDQYDHLTSMGTFTLVTDKIFLRAPKLVLVKVAMASIWICKPTGTNRVFCILGEMG